MLMLCSGVERSVGGRSVLEVDGLLKGLVCRQHDEAVMVWYFRVDELDLGKMDHVSEHDEVRLN